MMENKEFQARIQNIGKLVSSLDEIRDEEARSRVKTLLQLLMDLHSSGLERVLETIAKNQDKGQRIIDELGHDPLVGSLLILYGLHPLDFETRVSRAIEKATEQVRKSGGELSVFSL